MLSRTDTKRFFIRVASFFSVAILTFSSCKMTAQSIRKGEHLERAVEIPVEDFFLKRMKNKIKKTNFGNWDILFKDENYVYFGFTLLRFFGESPIVEILYKTEKLKLEEKFPMYQKFDGIEKNNLCREALVKENQTKNIYTHFLNCEAVLESNSISLSFTLVRQDKTTKDLKMKKTFKELSRFFEEN
jgi:hypothetical protein